LVILAGLTFGPLTAPIAQAQDYPARQITLIAPWPAGGAVDALCRAVAPHLSDRLGKSVVVENRPGAGSVIGTAAGAKAAPDGYTIVMAGSGSLAISATLYKKLPTKTRSPSAPEIPPIAEAGVPGFDAAGWGVFSVPAGTRKEVVSKLQTAIAAVVALPDVQQQIINLGMIPSGISSSSSASSAPRSRAGARSSPKRGWQGRSSVTA
jgi:tripartite-type tricarboxylate transporter receptor subunit TctC